MIRIFVVIAFFATLAQRSEAQNVPPPPPPKSEFQNLPPPPITRSEPQNLPPLPLRSEGGNLNYNNEDYIKMFNTLTKNFNLTKVKSCLFIFR